jgi:hypothetical protein
MEWKNRRVKEFEERDAGKDAGATWVSTKTPKKNTSALTLANRAPDY